MKNNYVIVGRERLFLKLMKYTTTVLLPILLLLIGYISVNVKIVGTVAWFKTYIVVITFVLTLTSIITCFLANNLLKETKNERIDDGGEASKTTDIT